MHISYYFKTCIGYCLRHYIYYLKKESNLEPNNLSTFFLNGSTFNLNNGITMAIFFLFGYIADVMTYCRKEAYVS